ncbi:MULTISPECIES: sodium/solute symporter [Bacteroides]|jgi:SSS family solute:Na+ symporter|uniref:sodium:solute symporter family transporter n=1 Tax=Bacteroides TaxID=816 RepID=UPI000E47E43F|nr:MULTISPECIES: sodium/solute symporter [Bacteroides]RHL12958.1 sodium transporter [Bacteroides sp. AF39-11AC]
MTSSISSLDIIIIIIFYVFIIWWALSHRKTADSTSYFLAGKKATWPIIGLSLFAASISSSTLIGHSGEGFISGIAVFNYNLMAVFVMVFFAIFFLPFYIQNGIFTIPEFLGKRFDSRSQLYFSFITIIGNIFLDAAAALYTGALILKMIFPEIDIFWIIIGIGLIAGSYSIVGGLSSILNADVIQSIILLIGSIILSYFCFESIGGWENLISHFQDGVWLKLIRPIDDPTVPWPGLFFGITILSFYFWGNNQVMVQRILSAKSVDEGRKGVLLVGLLYMFTLFIFIIPGLIARGIDIFDIGDTLPNEIINGGILKEVYKINTDEVYPRLITKLLPSGLIGLILAAMISALISTLSATLSSVSTLFTMDFYSHYVKTPNPKKLVHIGQISSFIALIIAIIWAPYIQRFDSLVGYYQEMVSYIAPPIVGTFILGVFWKRANAIGALGGLMFGLVVAISIMILKYIIEVHIPLHYLICVPILMLASMLTTIIISFFTPAPPQDKVLATTWNKKIWINESKELKEVVWYKNFRILCIILLICCTIEYLIFL